VVSWSGSRALGAAAGSCIGGDHRPAPQPASAESSVPYRRFGMEEALRVPRDGAADFGQRVGPVYEAGDHLVNKAEIEGGAVVAAGATRVELDPLIALSATAG
jgi:hypothetical protein